MPDIILRTSKLGKKFKNRWAAKDINLEVRQGDVFGFLGPNGAGKSTTIRMILSLIAPTEGSIELFGKNLATHREQALMQVAGIVEKPDFYLYLSAYRNVEIAGAMTLGRIPDRNSILDTLESVGLVDRALDKVKTFSHGMKQRLGIAQALLCNPKLVMLDEPTNGLDPQGMKEVRELILRLTTERGITVFLSSHLLNEVEQVATRMAIINKGTMVVQGTVEELLKANAHSLLVSVTPVKKAAGILKKNKNIRSLEVTAEGIVVTIDEKYIPPMIKTLTEENCKIFSVQPRRSLEDYFLKITTELTEA